MPNARLLRQLAFGNRTKVRSKPLQSMQDQVQSMLGWRAEYDAIGDAANFATQQSSTVVNGLRLHGISHTPIRTRVETNELSFFMPFAGGPIRSIVNGKTVQCHVGADALLAPEGERIGEGSYRSTLIANLDKRRLLQTAGAMLAQDEVSLDLGSPTVMPLITGAVNST